LATALALAVTAFVIADQFNANDPPLRAETSPSKAGLPESGSALLDGPAFESALARAVAAVEFPRSALLDGPAFESAIADTVAAVEFPRSALLDGAAFEAAIARAVAAID
jgi:hypothetical protein